MWLLDGHCMAGLRNGQELCKEERGMGGGGGLLSLAVATTLHARAPLGVPNEEVSCRNTGLERPSDMTAQ